MVKPPKTEVADHVATLRELGMNKQADRLLKDGEYSLGELRRLAVIDDPSQPLTALDVYRLKARGALENLRRLNPNFKAVTISERAGFADDLARRADDLARQADDLDAAALDDLAGGARPDADGLARQADDLDAAARAARGQESEKLARRADDLRADADRIRREIDDAERAFRGAAERAGETAGVTRWAQGARGLLTRDTRDDVGIRPGIQTGERGRVDTEDERVTTAGRGQDPYDTERRNPGNPGQVLDDVGRFTQDPYDTEQRDTGAGEERVRGELPGQPIVDPIGRVPKSDPDDITITGRLPGQP